MMAVPLYGSASVFLIWLGERLYRVNDYRKVGEKTGYAPLEMDQIPHGMIVSHQVEYDKKSE